jgi:hypothetical protein
MATSESPQDANALALTVSNNRDMHRAKPIFFQACVEFILCSSSPVLGSAR